MAAVAPETFQDDDQAANADKIKKSNARSAIGGLDPGNIIEGEVSLRKRKRMEAPEQPLKIKPSPLPTEDPAAVRAKGQKLYNIMSSAKFQNHLLSTNFMTLPSQEEYPIYYNMIKKPIAFDQIKTKLQQNQYPTFSAVRDDFNQVFVNAKRFNVRDSAIFDDAKKLHKLLRTRYPILAEAATPQLKEKLDEDKRRRKTAKKEAATFKGWLQKKLDEILNLSDSYGRKYCEYFMELPSKEDFPDYYEIIGRPMAFDIVQSKLAKRSYTTVQAFMSDVKCIYLNAQFYNEENSRIWLDAKTIQIRFEESMKEPPPVLTAAMKRSIGVASGTTTSSTGGVKLKLKLGGISEPPSHQDDSSKYKHDSADEDGIEFDEEDDEVEYEEDSAPETESPQHQKITLKLPSTKNEPSNVQNSQFSTSPAPIPSTQTVSPSILTSAPTSAVGPPTTESTSAQPKAAPSTSATNIPSNVATKLNSASTASSTPTQPQRILPAPSSVPTTPASASASPAVSNTRPLPYNTSTPTPYTRPSQLTTAINYSQARQSVPQPILAPKVISKLALESEQTALTSIVVRLHPSGKILELPSGPVRQHSLVLERRTDSIDIIPILYQQSDANGVAKNGIDTKASGVTTNGVSTPKTIVPPPMRVIARPSTVTIKELSPPPQQTSDSCNGNNISDNIIKTPNATKMYSLRPQEGLNVVEMKVGLGAMSEWKEVYRIFFSL